MLFDNGAGRSPTGTMTPGDPYPAFEQSFASLPIPGTAARQWYLEPGDALGDLPPGWRAVSQLLVRPAPLDWSRDYQRLAVQHPLEHERVLRTTESAQPSLASAVKRFVGRWLSRRRRVRTN